MIQGLTVVVEEGIATERGEGVRVTLPDGSQVVEPMTTSHRTPDAAATFAANKWRVDRWEAEGKRHAL